MIITHNEGIAGMADRIIRIHDGKIISNNPNKRISVKELVRHYMVYGMIPAFAGDVLGVLGSIPFSRAFCNFYFKDAEYIDYAVKIPYHLMLAAVLIPVAVYGLVSYLVLQGVLQSDIIPLLRGIGKEKVPYAMLGGQYEYGFKEFQTQNPYGGDGVFDISFGAKQDDSRFNLIGYEEQNQILDLLTVDGKELSYGGYYMSSAAAKRYGISAGDSFRFYNTVTMEETEIVISGII